MIYDFQWYCRATNHLWHQKNIQQILSTHHQLVDLKKEEKHLESKNKNIYLFLKIAKFCHLPINKITPDKALSNWRTLWKKSKRYENHIDAHISFKMWPKNTHVMRIYGVSATIMKKCNTCTKSSLNFERHPFSISHLVLFFFFVWSFFYVQVHL